MSDPWSVVWSVAALADLDDGARQRLQAAARRRTLGPGDALFREGALADALYVVVAGGIELRARRRGDEQRSTLRKIGAGQTLGEEAFEYGRRHALAEATEPTEVIELPAALFLRGAGRSGGAPLAERELRRLRRNATRDLLRTMAATRSLADPELDTVLDAAQPHTVGRGSPVFMAGDASDGLWLVVDGLVQLQTVDDDRTTVRAYLSGGDGFGHEDTLAGTRRELSAVAMGKTRLLRLPPKALRTVVDRNPGVLDRMARVAADRQQQQQQVVGSAAAKSTQHVFHDLYRMQMARSLLVIDQDTCVRCGHCAWTCESLHGVSRLVRRGDKIVARVQAHGAEARSLLVPNSCQHCENPACMIDCPTGAIGRQARGEVFIRESLCTGCGNCAKACPWENIRMAPRRVTPASVRAELSAEVATKCDLCRGYEAPGCVQSCPTGSIVRLDPTRDVAEVAAVLGGDAGSAGAAGRRGRDASHTVVRGIAVAASVALGVVGWRLSSLAVWSPDHGPGLWSGIVAAVGIVALMAHVLPKRVVGLWMRRSKRRSAARRLADRLEAGSAGGGGEPGGGPLARSKVRPWVSVHIVLGVLVVPAVLAHAGLRLPSNPAGSLQLALWLVVGLGLLGAVVYRVAPARLARIERRGNLPEDLRDERGRLHDRLFRGLSGRDPLVKTIASRVLVPYARRPLGALRLLLSGRTLAQEQARLWAQIDRTRQGRGDARLAGLDEAVAVAVELRALPARRGLTTLLRGWLPLHIVLATMLLALLGLHVALMLGGP